MPIPVHPENDSVIRASGSSGPSGIGLHHDAGARSIATVNRSSAHTLALRGLCKRVLRQVSGQTFHERRLLLDKHKGGQIELAGAVAGRVQAPGGTALAPARDAAEESRMARAPRDARVHDP